MWFPEPITYRRLRGELCLIVEIVQPGHKVTIVWSVTLASTNVATTPAKSSVFWTDCIQSTPWVTLTGGATLWGVKAQVESSSLEGRTLDLKLFTQFRLWLYLVLHSVRNQTDQDYIQIFLVWAQSAMTKNN